MGNHNILPIFDQCQDIVIACILCDGEHGGNSLCQMIGGHEDVI